MEFFLFLFLIIIFFYMVKLDGRISKMERNMEAGVAPVVPAKPVIFPKVETAVETKPAIENETGKIISMRTVSDLPKENEEKSASYPSVPLEKSVPSVPKPAEMTFSAEKKIETQSKNESFEFQMGGKIATWIGIVAVTLAVGFFLRYAFQMGYISETARVIMGLIFGAGLIVTGELTRKKYKEYGSVLTGGGLGILYLSIFASFAFYHLVPQPVAFFGMIVATLIGVILSVRYDSLPLAIFAQIGGLLTPILLSTNQNQPNALFFYLVILNLGILAVSVWKLWRPLAFIGFFGTMFLYLGWHSSFYDETQIMIAQGYLAVFFLIFFGVSLAHFFLKKAPGYASDLALLSINSFYYFIISYVIINSSHHDLMGAFTFFLGIFHLIFAFLARGNEESTVRLKHFLISIGIVLITIAIPIQLKKHWITIGWAAESLILLFLGFRFENKGMRYFANATFFLAFFRLITFDGMMADPQTAYFNDRVFSFMISMIFFILGAVLYRKNKDKVGKDEEFAFSYISFLAIFSYLFGWSIEIMDFFPHYWLSILWSVNFLLLVTISMLIEDISIRIVSYALVFLSACRILFFDIDVVDENWALINVKYLIFGIAIISSIFSYLLYHVYSRVVTKLEQDFAFAVYALYPYILFIWLVTNEIMDFHPQYWLPIAWSLIALAGGLVSFKIENIALRTAVYASMIFSFFHLLVSESSVDINSYRPLLNFRVGSYFAVVALTLVYLFFLRRQNDVSSEEKKAVSLVSFFAVNFFFVYVVSLEILDYFNQQYHALKDSDQIAKETSFANWKRASLSVFWALYSITMLISGIFKKSAMIRITAISFLGIVIFKVFLYDTAELNDFYRFVSYITLGIILLATGYLYNRYSGRIQGFIKIN
jgi:uncharacterized membrane protein